MKMLPLVAVVLAGMSIVPVVPAVAQQSYPLVCRGGGGMNASVTAGAVRVNFTPGTAAASSTPPAPGQCTWLDRGFRPGEPANLRLSGNMAGVRYLIDGVLGGGSFYAHVYNNGSGAMIVTRVGP